MKNKKFMKIINWLLTLGWMALIFYLSSVSDFSPVTGTTQRNSLLSDLVHVALYLVLTIFLIRAFLGNGYSQGKAFFMGFIVSLLYGCSDELHQYFVAGREARVSDWLLDLAGSYLTLSFYTYKYRPNRKKTPRC